MDKAELRAALIAAMQGDVLSVRVTPKASRNLVSVEEGAVRVYVTCVPENGKANKEVIKLLSKAFGVGRTRLDLIRGDTARDKQFRVDLA